MNDPQHEIRIWMQEELARMGHGAKGKLAQHLGVRSDAITRMMNTEPGKETRVIKAHELEAMRAFFSGTADDGPRAMPRESTVAVMGYLGAGAEIQPDFEQVPPEGLFEITVPFDLPDDLLAFEVRGDSMRPVYRDGHIIIVHREQKKPLESFYGQEAAVRTTDGRRYIKTIMRGDKGSVILSSWNADPIEGQRLEWIGEIFAILPPAAVRHLARHNDMRSAS